MGTHHPHHKHLEHPHAGGDRVKHHIKRKHGGKAGKGSREDMWVSGNPDVKAELEHKESYAKKGGRVHKGKHHHRHGGKAHHHHADGGVVIGAMTGGAVRPRLDRPGRKTGGRVGSDRAPLSSAHTSGHAEAAPREDGGN